MALIMPQSAMLKVQPQALEIAPGESEGVGVSVQNAGNIVDVFTIEVSGVDPDWVVVSPASVSLFPGDTSSGTVEFTLPRHSETAAGEYTAVVTVTSRKDPTDTISAEIALEVSAYYGLEASITPAKRTGATGEFAVSLRNTGNSPLDVKLDGSDREGLCKFLMEPDSPAVEPGGSADTRVVVTPGSRPLRPPSRSYQLTFKATPPDGTAHPVSMHAEFEATPRLPSWAIPAAIACVAVVALIVVAAIFFMPRTAPRTPFVIGAGGDATYGFDLPTASGTVLEVTLSWSSASDKLEVSLDAPNGRRITTHQTPAENPVARFTVADELASLGANGWKINVKNSGGEAVDGDLVVRGFDVE